MPTVEKKKTYPFTKKFREWLAVRSQGNTLRKRENDLKQGPDGDAGLKGAVMELGYEDEKGNFYYDLPRPVEFQDENGNVLVYTGLKAERALRPASPVPDPDLAEEYLRKKGMWLNELQESQIQQVRMLSPFVRIEIMADTEAVAQAYLDGIISPKDYNAILEEQTESFRFIPLQDK